MSYSATVILSEYRRAKAEFPDLMPAYALCVDGCVGNLVIPAEADVPALLYFDQNERFKRQVYGVWQKRRTMLFSGDWSRQIKDILPTNGEKCATQAADLFAWIGNKHETLKRQSGPDDREFRRIMELSMMAFFSAHPRGLVYDYDTIVAAYRRRLPNSTTPLTSPQPRKVDDDPNA